jgi:hypothetical protein
MVEEAGLVSHAVEGTLRWNIDPGPVQPFVFGGLALRRYYLTGVVVNRSRMTSTDGVVEVPFGVGVAFRHRHLTLEGRAGYHAAFAEDLVPGMRQQATGLDTWELAFAVGWER